MMFIECASPSLSFPQLTISIYYSTLKTLYEDDIEKFGKPEDTDCRTGEPVSSSSEVWLRCLSTEAPKIERVSRKRGGGGRKRKHSEMAGSSTSGGGVTGDGEQPENNAGYDTDNS